MWNGSELRSAGRNAVVLTRQGGWSMPNIGRFNMIYKISGSITLILALLVLGAWNFHTTVYVERSFNASVADVWRVWTDADAIKKWWGPKGYTALVVRNDVREGGSYLWAMKSEQ
jgi:hypothetical protein